MTDLFHECRSDKGMGYVRPLTLSHHKTPYRPTTTDFVKTEETTKPTRIKYYENHICEDCNLHVMRLVS